MTEDQLKHMVSRFLTWRLPENFNPDGGISFKATFNENTAHPMKHEPFGTNLFDATQATAMVRNMIEGMPLPEAPAAPVGEKLVEKLKNLLVGTEKKYNLTGDIWFFELWHALGEAAAALVAPAPTSAVDGADLITRITSFLSDHLSGPIQSRGNALLEEAVAALSKATLQGEAAVDGKAVKALEWKLRSSAFSDEWKANTVVGRYDVGIVTHGFMAIRRSVEDGQDEDTILAENVAEDEAKAAAQADYEVRIRSSLAPATLKKDEYVRGYVDGYKEGTLIDIDIASTSIAEMVADWYGNAPLPNARITPEVIAHRLARFAANPEAPAGRTVAWLIERKFPADGLSTPETRWYAENRLGFHWWTPTAAMAKRFTSKADVEAFNAYLMIDTDPTISITEHVFFGSLPEAPAAPVVEDAHGTDLLAVLKAVYDDILIFHDATGRSEDVLSEDTHNLLIAAIEAGK
ncbi:hypothetical protein NKH17_12700 [Mesorhizobium sp. M1334]|uniref:hypothetical protein n=1 Tax=Mesorhizobium sp. M1334 TaxID=2957084 RepID=UPI00333AADF9